MYRHRARFGINRLLFLILLAGLLSCSSGSALLKRQDFFNSPTPGVKAAFEDSYPAIVPVSARPISPQERRKINADLSSPDPALALYRDPETREIVVDYFCRLANSDDVALSILYHSDHLDVPLLLSFSLAWVESRYVPVAINVNDTSVDRGIFQLNSVTFPYLSTVDFFHPDTNISYGIQHLRWCLNISSDWRTAVAIYNAGLTRVAAGATPASTVAYVNRIMTYERGLAGDFKTYIQTKIKERSS